MPEDVKLPGIGATNKKWVYGGAALLIGIVGYAYWTRSKNAPVEPINPDALPEDRVPFTDAQVSSGASDSFTAGHPTTVADWVQMATDRLIELGRDSTLVASALGKYITRQPLTPAEQDIVRSAIGQFGTPPGGETFPILSATPPPSTGGGGTTAPPTTKTVHWEPHHLTANTTWIALARQYAGDPSNPNSVAQTKLSLFAHNPTLVRHVGTHNDAKLLKSWIVVVPVRR